MRRTPRLAPFALLLGVLLAASTAAQAPVGRLAEATGAVSVRAPGTGWANLTRGAVLAEGQTLRTASRTQAELDLGPNRLGLDPGTVLRIDSAHPATPAFTLEQGRVTVLLRSLRPGQVGRMDLAGGSVTFAEPGLYVVSAPEAGRPATVGVSRGLAQVYGPGVSLAVSAGQTGFFGGAEPAALRQGVAEGFLADDPALPPPQVVRPEFPPGPPVPDLADLPGAEPLRAEGQWADVPEYGTVWYPPVAPSWNPYADPWAADRWGYVPWNYGAWIMVGPRWAWMPPPRRAPPPAWRHAHPPPAMAQPHRPPPHFTRPAPHDPGVYSPGVPPPRRYPAPTAMPGPIVPQALPPAPHVDMPRRTPPPGVVPLPMPPAASPRLPVAPPPIPHAASPMAPRPMAAPHTAPPPVFAPRPASPPMAIAPPPPRMAPPPVMAAPPPPRPHAPPPRNCPPGRPGC